VVTNCDALGLKGSIHGALLTDATIVNGELEREPLLLKFTLSFGLFYFHGCLPGRRA
jgi:hypothetical protein